MACQMYYGCTPTELLDEAGALGHNLTSIHATHLTEHDIELLGGTGTGACFCPTTERDLADGIGPGRALHDAGTPLSIESDQHVVIDPFAEELRGIEMHERLVTNERDQFHPPDLLQAASFNGYRALGWSDEAPVQGGARRLRHRADRHGQHRRLGPEQIIYSASRPTCRPSSSAATSSCATASTGSATSAACSGPRSSGS